ncbi:late transcriptional activator [Bacillus phage VMY22]|uniref:Transcriptional regulator n=1 Tax=Bacillus phage VMY22 TaxID=1734382 RepID=A0A0N9SGQ0_9CAUD|nr:late transcriptional activator [Bacillus phage VMY22]ALH46474.1 transcriptional regulator [Bacillus phage VMY22]
MKTKRGVYHNIKESEYTVSNGDTVFFFTSDFYRQKFLTGYKEHRKTFKHRMSKTIDDEVFNFTFLSDMYYYREVEQRGFYTWIKGVEFDWQGLHLYALARLTEKNINDWREILKPKLGERKKFMESI